MKLSIGVSYLAIQAAGQIVISESEKHDFDEKRIEFEVLKKPLKILATDDVSEKEIDLPDHLKAEEWNLVHNIVSGNTHWLNSKQYSISELHGK